MKNLVSVTLVFMAFLACTHDKGALPTSNSRVVSTDERTKKSHMELSYKDLSSIMLTVMYTVDGHELGCPVKPHQLASLSQNLKALLDERFETDMQMYTQLKKKERAQYYPTDCQAQCNCNAYTSFAEYLEQHGVKFAAAEKAAVQKISATRLESSKNPTTCLEKDASWVCDSDVFQSLTVE